MALIAAYRRGKLEKLPRLVKRKSLRPHTPAKARMPVIPLSLSFFKKFHKTY